MEQLKLIESGRDVTILSFTACLKVDVVKRIKINSQMD